MSSRFSALPMLSISSAICTSFPARRVLPARDYGEKIAVIKRALHRHAKTIEARPGASLSSVRRRTPPPASRAQSRQRAARLIELLRRPAGRPGRDEISQMFQTFTRFRQFSENQNRVTILLVGRIDARLAWGDGQGSELARRSAVALMSIPMAIAPLGPDQRLMVFAVMAAVSFPCPSLLRRRHFRETF